MGKPGDGRELGPPPGEFGGVLKTYRLTVNLSIIEVPEPEPAPSGEIESESSDPVERDREEISSFTPKAMIKAFKEAGIFPSARPPMMQLPAASITTHNAYNVGADSIDQVVSIVRKFEALAESVGTFTNDPGPTSTVPSYYFGMG